jgi:ubiquinone/menaquinone biosynthesis C-methylase UbiE
MEGAGSSCLFAPDASAMGMGTADHTVDADGMQNGVEPAKNQVGQSVLVARMAKTSELFRESFTGGKTDAELAALYDKWAKAYVADLSLAGYKAPENGAEHFRANLPKHLDPATAKVLDCGCGTGLVGAQLMLRTDRVPFCNLHGVDFSLGMLEQARDKPYRSLQQGNVLKPLDIADNEFDSLVTVGMFTAGNVGPEALDQLMRIVKPGGIVTATIQDHIYEPEGFPAKIAALEKAGVCTVIEHAKIVTMESLDTYGHCVTFAIL